MTNQPISTARLHLFVLIVVATVLYGLSVLLMMIAFVNGEPISVLPTFLLLLLAVSLIFFYKQKYK